jgi:FkbM family methyltransferase
MFFRAIFNSLFAVRSQLKKVGNHWIIEDLESELSIHLRTPRDAHRYSRRTIQSKLVDTRKRYSLSEFVEVTPGDIVVDVGGYIGEFALSVARDASMVHIFEPDEMSFNIMKKNVQINSVDSEIYCYNQLIWSEVAEISFNSADDGSESSALKPDVGGVIQTSVISAIPLHEAIDFNVDFLKIDAEGSELRVIEGLGDLRPRKIAIDCTEVDANGDLPDTKVEEAILSLGYVTKSVETESGHMIFGKLEN